MCGIIAVHFSDPGRPVDRDRLAAATDCLRHRGPDGSGMFFDGNLGFGHRRLSIIDLPAGRQPMTNEDGSIVLIYNGEIYNFQELREQLLSRGHQFKSRSDTEVIVHAYEEWGVECVQRLNGMFAFALWDQRRRSLWVVRDRLGIKPLYYLWDGSIFACASEIKPLLQLGLVKAEVNPRVLDAYFTLGYVPAPETLFARVLKLKPGHHILLQGGSFKLTEYWDFADIPARDVSFETACETVADLLKDSVKRCLVSDVPVGVFLSGGIDSTATLALMDELGQSPISTFTVGFGEKFEESEEAYAQIAARRYQTRHHVLTLEPEGFYSSIKTLVKHCEEPVVEAASIALYHLSNLAEKHVKVLLSGEGSDEVFGGYSLYNVMLRIEDAQRCIPPSWLARMAVWGRRLPQMKARKYLDWLAQPLASRYRGTSGYLTDSLKRELYSPDFYSQKGDYLDRTFGGHFEKVKSQPSALNQMLYVDSKTWLADDILLKADRMTMAASVELRVPFLDHRIVEYAASLPASCKSRFGEGKYLLKSIMANRLPPEITWRKKRGFPLPTQQWFGDNLLPFIRDRIGTGNRLPWINPGLIERVLTQHQQKFEDHSKLILSLLVISSWMEQYIE